MRLIKTLFVFVGVFLVGVQGALAFDIFYANVEDIAGDTVLLRYRTTDGYGYSECDTQGGCGKIYYDTERAPDLFPSINGTTSYTTSVDGTIGVVLAEDRGSQVYEVYSIKGSRVREIARADIGGVASRVSVSYANDAVLFLKGSTLIRFDINRERVTEFEAGQSSFPFWSSSEHGNIVASYAEGAQTHTFFDIARGEKYVRYASIPSYVVFSNSENRIAFLNNVSGFNKLFVGTITSSSMSDVMPGNFTVVEYEFIGETLYFIANSEAEPYVWNLYAFSPGGSLELVAEDIAYDDSYTNLKKTHTQLFFEKVDGSDKHVIAYTPGSRGKQTVALKAEGIRTDAPREIRRSVMTVGGRHAVLLEPETPSRELPLIVWLHGGPARQTSLAYHPFFGYAVYDNLLERFAEHAYVLKIDYLGSWGHGNEILKGIRGNVGQGDVADVLLFVDTFKLTHSVSDTHLFGPSYGGYLSLKTLVERPDDFESAVSIAGVLDWESLIERIPSSPFSVHFSGSPAEHNRHLYEQASILNKIENIQGKDVVLMYGDRDATVPVWQSKEFFEKALEASDSVSLVEYVGEGHTIVSSAHLEDVCVRLSETFGISKVDCR